MFRWLALAVALLASVALLWLASEEHYQSCLSKQRLLGVRVELTTAGGRSLDALLGGLTFKEAGGASIGAGSPKAVRACSRLP